MKKVFRALGVISFYVLLPALALVLNRSERTRIIVTHGTSVLVLKGWLGNTKWILPGGGLHKSEEPIQGAIRELYEETGIACAPGQLQSLGMITVHEHAIVRYRTHVYRVVLDSLPEITMQKNEIAEYAWVNPIIATKTLGATTKQVLRVWNSDV